MSQYLILGSNTAYRTSLNRLTILTTTIKIIKAPCIAGKSLYNIAKYMYLPNPGMLKVVSVKIAPDNSKANCKPIIPTVGTIAFFEAYLYFTVFSGIPLERAK